MIDLDRRLTALGEVLELDDTHMVDRVFARLDGTTAVPASRPDRSRPLRVAVAILVVLAALAAAVPSSRRTVAGWFGFDGVTVERRPDLSVPATPPVISIDADGPGDSEIVIVDGATVLVSTIDGLLDETVIEKTVGSSSDVVAVTVDGRRGLWIGGVPHELRLRRGGELLIERVAGNTLLWQDGDSIRRLEGFDTLEAALTYAATIGT